MATANFHAIPAVNGRPFRPVGSHTQIADLSTAKSITRAAGGKRLLMQALAQPVTFTLDGTTPTSAKGFVLAAGDAVLIDVADDVTIKVIQTAASATLEYQWSE